MKSSVAVAVATGALVIAFGGIAMAAEPIPVDDAVVAATVTPEASAPPTPEEPTPEEPAEDDAPVETAGTGLECSLVPGIEIADILESGAIECSGTGSERSAEVALVPRYLAHAAEVAGAERGAIISAWAKTHANQKSDEGAGGDSDAEADAAASGDDAAATTEEPPASATSPGRSGDAPGHGGSTPGNGRGR